MTTASQFGKIKLDIFSRKSSEKRASFPRKGIDWQKDTACLYIYIYDHSQATAITTKERESGRIRNNNKRVMYKSKLQQLSQKRGWHSPHFYATVTVDATLFSTPFPLLPLKKLKTPLLSKPITTSPTTLALPPPPLNGNWIPFVSL